MRFDIMFQLKFRSRDDNFKTDYNKKYRIQIVANLGDFTFTIFNSYAIEVMVLIERLNISSALYL